MRGQGISKGATVESEPGVFLHSHAFIIGVNETYSKSMLILWMDPEVLKHLTHVNVTLFSLDKLICVLSVIHNRGTCL